MGCLGRREIHIQFRMENLNGRDNLGDPGVNRILLKCNLKPG
jgi:hypothetical protein